MQNLLGPILFVKTCILYYKNTFNFPIIIQIKYIIYFREYLRFLFSFLNIEKLLIVITAKPVSFDNNNPLIIK